MLESLCQILVGSISHHATVGAARAGRAPLPRADRAPAGRLLPGRVRAGGQMALRLAADRAPARLPARGVARRPPPLVEPRPPRGPRAARGSRRTNCVETLDPLSIEYRMLARDGRVVWIRDEGALRAPGRGDGPGAGRGRAHRHHRAPRGRGGAAPPRRPRRAHGPRQPPPLHRRARAAAARRRRARRGRDPRRRRPQVRQRLARPRRRRFAAALGRRRRSMQVARPGEFLARFGGDEFTVLLDVADRGGGAPPAGGAAARRARARVARPRRGRAPGR